MLSHDIKPPAPLLILMHGLPAAGKSAFARQYADKHRLAHVNSDRIRYELFDDIQLSPSENRTVHRLASYMAEELMKQSQSLIFDMNLPSFTMRQELKKQAERYGFNFLLAWVQTDYQTAQRRAGLRDRRRQDDKYSPTLSPQLFDRVAGHTGQPNPERETVAVISGQQAFAQQTRLLEHRLRDLGFLAGGTAVGGGRVDLTRRRVFSRTDNGPRRV